MLAGLVPSKGWERVSLLCLCPGLWWFSGNLQCSLACRNITPVCAFIFSGQSPMCLSPHFLFTRTPVLLGQWPILTPIWPNLNLLHLQLPYSQGRSHTEVLRVKMSTYKFGRTQIHDVLVGPHSMISYLSFSDPTQLSPAHSLPSSRTGQPCCPWTCQGTPLWAFAFAVLCPGDPLLSGWLTLSTSFKSLL